MTIGLTGIAAVEGEMRARLEAKNADIERLRDTLAAVQAYADKRVARWAARAKKAGDTQAIHQALMSEARAVSLEVTRLIKHGPRPSGGAGGGAI